MSNFSNLPDPTDPDYTQKMRDIGAPLHKSEVSPCDLCQAPECSENCLTYQQLHKYDDPREPCYDLCKTFFLMGDEACFRCDKVRRKPDNSTEQFTQKKDVNK